jgi:YfiH family protein
MDLHNEKKDSPFRLARRGSIEYVEAEPLAALGFVTHAFCTRHRGVSSGPYASLNLGYRAGDRRGDVDRNRTLVEEAFDIPAGGLILMGQVHGDCIRVVEGSGAPAEGLPECDGLMTDRPGIALGIRTADCVPLFFVDRLGRAIGAAHAGWRGTAGGIAGKMVESLANRFSMRREDLLALIGPSIGPCCYEVDAPVFDRFSALPGAGEFLRACQKEGRWMADLALANRLQILQAGLPAENIFSSGLCTACRQDLFFSHRAGGGTAGRQISLLMLRPGHEPKNA